jgi:type III secretion system FlhB-like substrate exporter
VPEIHDFDHQVDEEEALVLKLGGQEYRIADVPQSIMATADELLVKAQKTSGHAAERAERKAARLKADADRRAEGLRAEGKTAEAEQLIEQAEDDGQALIDNAYRSVDPYFFHKRLAIWLQVPEDTFYAVGRLKVRRAHDLVQRHLLGLRGETAGKGSLPTSHSNGESSAPASPS